MMLWLYVPGPFLLSAAQLLEPPKPLESIQLLPPSYCVYIASLKRIINKTPRLQVLLKALEASEALKASEPKTHDDFWAA